MQIIATREAAAGEVAVFFPRGSIRSSAFPVAFMRRMQLFALNAKGCFALVACVFRCSGMLFRVFAQRRYESNPAPKALQRVSGVN